MGELLRDRAPPGYASDIDLRVAELRNETGGKPCERRRAVRQERPRRAADTRRVKDDRRRARERLKERLRQLPIGADPVEQQQRRLLTAPVPDGDLEQLPIDRDFPRLDLARLLRRGRPCRAPLR